MNPERDFSYVSFLIFDLAIDFDLRTKISYDHQLLSHLEIFSSDLESSELLCLCQWILNAILNVSYV